MSEPTPERPDQPESLKDQLSSAVQNYLRVRELGARRTLGEDEYDRINEVNTMTHDSLTGLHGEMLDAYVETTDLEAPLGVEDLYQAQIDVVANVREKFGEVEGFTLFDCVSDGKDGELIILDKVLTPEENKKLGIMLGYDTLHVYENKTENEVAIRKTTRGNKALYSTDDKPQIQDGLYKNQVEFGDSSNDAIASLAKEIITKLQKATKEVEEAFQQ